MDKNMLGLIKDTLKSYWLFFIPHHLFSRFTYIITRTRHPLTKYLINLYISLFRINLKECERESVDDYDTFCDFFTRKLKKGVRVCRKSIIGLALLYRSKGLAATRIQVPPSPAPPDLAKFGRWGSPWALQELLGHLIYRDW